MGNFSPLSALDQRRIVDPSGQLVGRIHDVLLDLRDGRVEYICIALDESPDKEDSEVVVPWSALRSPRDGASDWEIAAGKRLLQRIAQPVSTRR